MSNTRIKITSNPYERNTTFSIWEDGWVPIDAQHNPNSRLLSADITKGFFPFKAESIVRGIIAEYGAVGHVVDIEFEGSLDEFQELDAVCSLETFAPLVHLTRGTRYLQNARDVLPEIVRIYGVIKDNLNEDALDDAELLQRTSRLTDASSNAIPICVLGNYSSGKSTFINALIGQELLPNGDEPVTARVYQIKRSKTRDMGTISFTYDGSPFVLHYNNEGLISDPGFEDTTPFNDISAHLKDSPCESLVDSMSQTLTYINRLKSLSNGMGMSNRVDITVPFSTASEWGQTAEFVIFDTPGSNAVIRSSDAEILKEAMRGLTNGLPVYVTAYDTLDSDDNRELYNEIASIDAVDERFAMIIVNKADGASLPKTGFTGEELERFMDQQIPRTLYAQGIYFVSSVMALSTKIDGEFASDDYAEKYEDFYNKFANPKSRFYRVLYRYNILPAQIAERTLEESSSCDDLVFANSGMYCVEHEIERFADRYSAYNKCQQSRILLEDIIRMTKAAMEQARHNSESANEALKNSLESDKQQLLDSLHESWLDIRRRAEGKYKEGVDFKIAVNRWLTSYATLRKREEELAKLCQLALGLDGQGKATRKAFNSISENFKSRVSNAFNGTNEEGTPGIAQGFLNDVDAARKQREKLQEIGRQADVDTSDALLIEIREKFDASVEEIVARTEELARDFWQHWANESRTILYNLATGSDVLTLQKRNEIADIIINYPPLSLNHNADIIFARANFERVLRVWFITLFKSERLDLNKLADTYNEELRKRFRDIKLVVKENYRSAFEQWLRQLLNQITERITDYNPVLHRHIMEIKTNTERIGDLTMRLNVIEQCADEVTNLIEWKE